jgi:hypothetical protein
MAVQGYRYFYTSSFKAALDVNAHNKYEQQIFKHPDKDEWIVPVLPGNKYILLDLNGKLLDSWPESWGN